MTKTQNNKQNSFCMFSAWIVPSQCFFFRHLFSHINKYRQLEVFCWILKRQAFEFLLKSIRQMNFILQNLIILQCHSTSWNPRTMDLKTIKSNDERYFEFIIHQDYSPFTKWMLFLFSFFCSWAEASYAMTFTKLTDNSKINQFQFRRIIYKSCQ